MTELIGFNETESRLIRINVRNTVAKLEPELRWGNLLCIILSSFPLSLSPKLEPEPEPTFSNLVDFQNRN